MDDFDLYRLFKTLHVISITMLGGGIATAGIVGPLLPRVRTMQEVRVLARLLSMSELFLLFPSFLLIAVFGYLTADRLNIQLDATWLLLGQIAFYIGVVLSLTYMRMATNRLNKMAQAAPDGPVPAEVTAELSKPGPAIVGGVLTLLYVAIIYLMVAKPSW